MTKLPVPFSDGDARKNGGGAYDGRNGNPRRSVPWAGITAGAPLRSIRPSKYILLTT